MENWLRISLTLCTFGFFREMRPSEPFVTEFLSGEWRNVTMDQVNRDVYPMGTYSYLSQLIIIFLITDMLRYKPVIVISGCVGIILWSILLWTYTLTGLQIGQVFYGTFMAAEIAYYTYMYAKVDRSKYQQVTGHTRSAILSGRFLAGVLAQLLISFELMDTRELNYISLASQCVSLIWALLLPSVKTSMYFYSTKKSDDDLKINDDINIERNEKQSNNDTNNNNNNGNNGNNNNNNNNNNGNNNNNPNGNVTNEENYLTKKTISMTKIDNNNKNNNNNNNDNDDDRKVSFSWTRAFRLLWFHFKTAYTNVIVLQWSIWWALAMCGFLIVQSYVQVLWAAIQFEQGYNGAVEAALTLLGAFGAFGAGFLDSKQFNRFDIWILTICSAAEGGFILWSAFTDSIWVAYIMYILFGTLYHFMITVASATVAKKINEDSFALIFGINTLMALVLQTILTIVFISESGFMLDARGQFIVFGCYFIGLAIVYGTVAIIKSIMKNR